MSVCSTLSLMMNTEFYIGFKITNWCNMNCAHCCECSGLNQPLNFMSLDKLDRYLFEAKQMDFRPNQLITIGGGEAFAPYLNGDNRYIPNALDIAYSHKFIPTLKTNGTWGENNKKCQSILSDLAKCAYKGDKLVTLDISVDEFHNNTTNVANIIRNTLRNDRLCMAIRICLVGFHTKKSEIAQNKLKQELQKYGLKVSSTVYGDWIVETKNGADVYMTNDFSAEIVDLGRAKTNSVFTTVFDAYSGSHCLQIDNNDIATYNFKYREPINNRHLGEVFQSLLQRAYNHR